MKKGFIIAIIFSLTIPSISFADETTEVYRRLYFESDSLFQRYTYIQEITALNDPSTGSVLAEALRDFLDKRSSIKTGGEIDTYENLGRLLVAGLGTLKYTLAAEDIYKAMQGAVSPLFKAECLIALGRIRAVQYFTPVNELLNNINNKPTPDRDAGEQIAYGCILSLSKMRDVRAFKAIFNAVDGWYTLRVRQTASNALVNLIDDPTVQISEIIDQDSSARKLVALRHELKSKATLENKILTSVLALREGFANQSRDREEELIYVTLRTEAMRYLIQVGAKNPDSVSLFRQSFMLGDVDEKLIALEALGVNASDQAAQVLVDIILDLNRQRSSDIADETRDRIAKAAIINAGRSKNPIVKPALITVKSNQKWSSGVIISATEALKAFQ